MPQFAVSGPGSKLDLGDQGRRDPDHVCLSGIGNRWLLPLPVQLVQRRAQPDRLGCLKARADAPNMNKIMVAVGGKYERPEAARRRRRWLIADDHEGFTLDAFDLHPVAGAAGPIGPIEMLADMANCTTQHGTMEGVPLHLHIGNLDIALFHTSSPEGLFSCAHFQVFLAISD